MNFKIAIQPDQLQLDNGLNESYSERWICRARDLGHEVVVVDVFCDDIVDQLGPCDGFMWRFTHAPFPRLFAKRFVIAVEHGLDLIVFPDWRTCWHYDDKIAQYYLLTAAGIPTPRTWVFWRPEDALRFCRSASYPLVIKLSGGASSENVRIIEDFGKAKYWIGQMFSSGVFSLQSADSIGFRERMRRFRSAFLCILRGQLPNPGFWFELNKNYLLVQEFLHGNQFDTRVTIIGNRAFAFRRFNRPDDFRASGSGDFSTDPSEVDLQFVRLGFNTAYALGAQSLAVDGLYGGNERVIAEISYTYVAWVIHECPGHWELRGSPATGELIWREGHIRSEDAIMEDFLQKINLKYREKFALS